MLIDIYARSMMTATRQDCVKLRDLPAAAPLPRPPRRLARLLRWLKFKPQKTRCIPPRNI